MCQKTGNKIYIQALSNKINNSVNHSMSSDEVMRQKFGSLLSTLASLINKL